jgi:hypothetical protein
MLGSRSLIHDRWKVTTDHVSRGVLDEEELMVGSRDFDADRWALFNLDDDPAEVRDVADDHPDVVKELVSRWWAEAERNQVLPLADDLVARAATMTPPPHPPRPRSTYLPAGGPVPDEAIPLLFGGGTVVAEVDVPDAPAGVLVALGDHTNGFAALVDDDGRLTAVLSVAGDAVEARAGQPVPAGRHELGLALVPGDGGTRLEALVDGEVVAAADGPHPMPFAWQHGGTSMTLGYDRGFPVTPAYRVPARWNGVLHRVVVEVGRPAAAPPPVEAVQEALAAE